MSVQLLTEQDWNANTIMGGDGKLGGSADGMLTEDEYAHAVVEATAGAVTDEQARGYFKDMTEGKVYAEGQQAYLTPEHLQGMAGDIYTQMDKFNKNIALEGSLFGDWEASEEDVKKASAGVFKEMDLDGSGEVDRNEFISHMKNKALNGAKVEDSELSQMFDEVAKRNGDKETISEKDFVESATSLQQYLNDAAAEPLSDMEKITKMFERLMFQMMTGGSGQGNLF